MYVASLKMASLKYPLACDLNGLKERYSCLCVMECPWVHIAPSKFGSGLFANCRLEKDQTITEYTGPRLSISRLKPGSHCAFHIPGTKVFIDGGGEYSNSQRCIASFANHSDAPNAALQVWPVGKRHRVMLVTLDVIDPGGEILINYNAGEYGFEGLSNMPPGYSAPSYEGPYPEKNINEFEKYVLPRMRMRYLKGVTICNEDGTRLTTPRIENIQKFIEDGMTSCAPFQIPICLPIDIPCTSYII